MSSEAEARRDLRLHALKDPTRTILIDEFWIPRTNERADLVAIGTSRTAYEIKSNRDNLKRLPRQIEAYSRTFDKCVAAIAHRHLEQVARSLPPWWGIALISAPGEEISILRPPMLNPELDPSTVVRLLWKAEVSAILTQLNHPPAQRATRSEMWAELLTLVDTPTLSIEVNRALRQRSRILPMDPIASPISG